ncbi:MAG: antibiotic biosynthesis monooxygenase [Planctomycetales bacterium]|nr:antibiotic biosynthesis monooxygenase [Planctomycetales bacterium]
MLRPERDQRFAQTPSPPYYVAVFTSLRNEGDCGYGVVAQRMLELACQQPGYLGVESARDADGFGITVSYWSSEEAIAAWKAQAEHAIAQQTGRNDWYSSYELRVAKVERAVSYRAS